MFYDLRPPYDYRIVLCNGKGKVYGTLTGTCKKILPLQRCLAVVWQELQDITTGSAGSFYMHMYLQVRQWRAVQAAQLAEKVMLCRCSLLRRGIMQTLLPSYEDQCRLVLLKRRLMWLIREGTNCDGREEMDAKYLGIDESGL